MLESNLSSQQQSERNCRDCADYALKMKELTWSYEELIEVKDKEIASLHSMITSLEAKLNRITQKSETSIQKIYHLEESNLSQQKQLAQKQEVITYFQQREIGLLSKLKEVENALFVNSFKGQQTEENEKRPTEQYEQGKRRECWKQVALGRERSACSLLNRSALELEKAHQQRNVLELKHRMAVLRAVQFSVLK